MKRTTQTEAEWELEMEARKVEAEKAMIIADHVRGFVTLSAIDASARIWGVSKHTAEMKLTRGELPEGFPTSTIAAKI